MPPARFTAERDALAGRLAAEGDAAQAASVRKVRRPVGLAWVLNRVARDQGSSVAALLDAGDRLRAGHAAALAGEGAGPLRAADEALHVATRALRGPAEAALREAGRAPPPGALARVEQLLRAAALGEPGVREALRSGTLLREPDVAASGGIFGAAAGARPAQRGQVSGGADGGPRLAEEVGADRQRGPRAGGTASAARAERSAVPAASAAPEDRRRRAERAERAARDERAARASEDRARAREQERARRALAAAERAATMARRDAEGARRGAEAARRTADAAIARAERARARADAADAEVVRRREEIGVAVPHAGPAPRGPRTRS